MMKNPPFSEKKKKKINSKTTETHPSPDRDLKDLMESRSTFRLHECKVVDIYFELLEID